MNIIKLTCRYQLPSLIDQYNAKNHMDHNSSPNPIKIYTKSLKQLKTLFKYHYLSRYSNITNIIYVSVLIP